MTTSSREITHVWVNDDPVVYEGQPTYDDGGSAPEVRVVRFNGGFQSHPIHGTEPARGTIKITFGMGPAMDTIIDKARKKADNKVKMLRKDGSSKVLKDCQLISSVEVGTEGFTDVEFQGLPMDV